MHDIVTAYTKRGLRHARRAAGVSDEYDAATHPIAMTIQHKKDAEATACRVVGMPFVRKASASLGDGVPRMIIPPTPSTAPQSTLTQTRLTPAQPPWMPPEIALNVGAPIKMSKGMSIAATGSVMRIFARDECTRASARRS